MHIDNSTKIQFDSNIMMNRQVDNIRNKVQLLVGDLVWYWSNCDLIDNT